ncbi:MAG TPA: hypothetical protein VMZ73_02325 [Acidimicrobiales bacterium]|nr:hypothetical protein [Acidimicrobiales bacterium]
MKRFLALSATLLLAAGASLAGPAVAPAWAHETRTGGPVRFVVGWGDEPSYTGFKNSVQVTVSEASGAPITDLGDALTVEVIKGDDRATLPLVPNFRVGAFGTPGDYRAWLTPTRPGGYSFHLTGAIRGQKVDETFTSSKTTFNDVEDVTNIAFPAKDPSTGQLAARIDREVPRLEKAVEKADSRADTAQTLALLGLGVGVVGLLAAAGALVVARRRGEGAGVTRSVDPVSEMARPNA